MERNRKIRFPGSLHFQWHMAVENADTSLYRISDRHLWTVTSYIQLESNNRI